MLFFRFAQDVAHIDEGYRALRRIQRPRASLSLAGFQVTFIGRFWVTPEDRYSVDVCASSTFDAAHLFVAHAKADPRNGIPRPTVNSEFEVVVDGKIHRVTGKALQQWIAKQREERNGPAGYIFSKRPNLF